MHESYLVKEFAQAQVTGIAEFELPGSRGA